MIDLISRFYQIIISFGDKIPYYLWWLIWANFDVFLSLNMFHCDSINFFFYDYIVLYWKSRVTRLGFYEEKSLGWSPLLMDSSLSSRLGVSPTKIQKSCIMVWAVEEFSDISQWIRDLLCLKCGPQHRLIVLRWLSFIWLNIKFSHI